MDFPNLIDAKVELKDKDTEIGLATIGDVHYGSGNCNSRALKQWIGMIKEKGWLWIAMGDLTENALTNSKSDVYTQLIPPEKQIRDMVEMLAPIKDQCLGQVPGNHGARTVRMAGLDPDEIIAHELGVPYYRYTAAGTIRLYRGGRTTCWKIMAHHTAGGGYTSAGKLRALKKMASIYPMMDLYMGGHTHASVSDRDARFDISIDGHGKRPVKRELHRHFSACGSLLKYEGSYGEAKLMPPAIVVQVVHLLGSSRHRKTNMWQKPYQRIEHSF